MKSRSLISRYSVGLVHTLIWSLIILVPALSLMIANGSNWQYAIFWMIPVSGWMTMFYINYYLLIPRVLFRHHPWPFVGWNLLIGMGVIIYIEIFGAVAVGEVPAVAFTLYYLIGILAYFMLFMFLILAAISIRSLQRNKQLEQERNMLNAEQAAMELSRLKSQLNPHFLFNSLNNISALSAIDPEAAQQAIHTLSSMLRYVLYDTAASLVSLRSEIAFIRNYIDLMSLRYTDLLKLDLQGADDLDPAAKVPPMLFISLIENAFKYGASSTHPSSISIMLSMQGDDKMSMRITNTLLIPGISAPAEKVRPEKHGVGQKNLRRRLEILFPGRHMLSYGMNDVGLYEALITIPLTYAAND